MTTKHASKAEFVRNLSASGSRWHYVWCGDPKRYDIDYVVEAINNDIDNARSKNITIDTRSYKNTSGYRLVSNLGSILDLTKKDSVYAFDNGYIVENDYVRLMYVRIA